MWKKDNIEIELKEMAPALVGLSSQQVYSVPTFYFSALPEIVMDRVKLEVLHTTSSIQPTYQAPEGYFDNLAAQIMSKVKLTAVPGNEVEEELKSIAPALVGLSKQPTYGVPEGYFANINIATSPVKHVQVVSMFSRTRVLRYLAAAVVVAVLAISSYLYLGKTPEASIAAAPVVNVPAAVEKLSEQEISDYLQAHSSTADIEVNAFNLPDTEADFDELIKELPDDELQQFLKQYPLVSTSTLKNS